MSLLLVMLLSILGTLLAVGASVWISSRSRPPLWTLAWLKRSWRRAADGGFARTAMLVDPVSGRGASMPVLLSYSVGLFLLGCAVTGSRLLLSRLEVRRLTGELERSGMPVSLGNSNASMRGSLGIVSEKASANS